MRRIVFWTLVAVYTLVLPHAISVYNIIEKHLSSRIAAKVPLAIIFVFGIVYIVSIVKMKRGIKSWLLLLPCTIIVYAFIRLEPNPNKHIHIPEYIVMAWLLFETLSLDYKGRGIFFLIFICSSMLGIIDELIQGILPGRSYGWHDMVMNSASSVVGILTLAGLRTIPAGDWTWIGGLTQLKKTLAIIFIGAVGAMFTCIYLFHVHTLLRFEGIYPGWLLVWNSLFMLIGLIILFCPTPVFKSAQKKNNRGTRLSAQAITARLWIIAPLVILIVIHGVGALLAATGWPFS